MNFTDLLFLFGFLPIVWLLYSKVKLGKWSNLFLLIASLIFCAWGSGYALLILLVVLFATWMAVKGMEAAPYEQERKNILYAISALLLLILFVYKYLPVWFSFLPVFHDGTPASLRMPAGLSFYMFSCFTCIFDVYYRKAPAPRSFVDLGFFAAFFARLNMGPIGHYAREYDQLLSHPQTSAKNRKGVSLFMQGLFMKVIIADRLSVIRVMLEADRSAFGALVLLFAYAFELYFDFAGYSRMARGIGSLFGFEIPMNFDRPFSSLSVSEFWRRWHISLTDWFRDYIYIPLGGNRVDQKRWMLNIFAVWGLTGLWHGATLHYIIWGLYEGALIILERTVYGESMKKWPNALRHVYVVITQLVGIAIMCAPSMGSALGVFGRVFMIGASSFVSDASMFALWGAPMIWIMALLGLTLWPSRIAAWLKSKTKQQYVYVQTAGYGAAFLLCLASLMSSSAQVFLYAAF